MPGVLLELLSLVRASMNLLISSMVSWALARAVVLVMLRACFLRLSSTVATSSTRL